MFIVERTDNTIAKRKSTKGQTTIYKALHRKQKIEQLKTRSEFGCSRKMSSIYSTSSRNLIRRIDTAHLSGAPEFTPGF
jgi:hypothetical protein